MPTLESFIYLCFAAAVPVMGAIAVIMAIQTFTLGTQAHQEACREKVKAATNPDTSTHAAYYLGFFHLYPNIGGGGERVLWTMIKAIQDKYPFIVSVIYSGDGVSRDQLLQNVQAKFGLTLRPDTIYVVELSNRWWVDHKFPRFTMLMQSLGSVILAAKAIHQFCPDVFVETVGFAFTYPLIHLLSTRIPIVAYTHYPTINSDMLTMVSSREAGVNNNNDVARSPLLSALKTVYYRAFAIAYSFAGSFASTIMTNSTWTQNHIVELFGNPKMTKVVYPPCDTQALLEFAPAPRQPLIVSLAQFRPEKNHKTQVEAFAHLLRERPEFVMPPAEKSIDSDALLEKCRNGSVHYPVLVMLGGARNIEDEARAEELRQLAKRLGVERQVLVIVNAPWSQVQEWLRLGKVGMHTMRDEHFGINIVEMMAAGLLTIAHDSAGPKLDIIAPAIRGVMPTDEEESFPVGFVATTAEEFAKAIALALDANDKLVADMQKAARTLVKAKFSEDAFRSAFYKRFDPVVRWLDNQRSTDDD
ncbi:asparagine-linked glycosylation protein [Coemansia sp. 'formosensis']|nr:asparagine-linked glycosylation protein [Coemansia sp. 'formosensis']